MTNGQQQIEVGCHVRLGGFQRWYEVVGFEEASMLVLRSETGGEVKAHRAAISEARPAQGLAKLARDLEQRR